MSSSEEDEFGREQRPVRVRRHRFKTFAERVAEVRPCSVRGDLQVGHEPRFDLQVDVDVYRRLGPVRDAPQGGSATFLGEAVHKWRELNTTEHFTSVASAVLPLSDTLPQLVHHADQVRGTEAEAVSCRQIRPYRAFHS
jgi:hypothetical protein